MTERFDTLWTNELEPWLAEREVEYRAMVRRGRKFALITLGISLVIVGILWLVLAVDTERLLIALAVALLTSGAAWITGSSGIGALSTQIKHQVLNRLAEIFDLHYASKPAETTRFRRFQQLGILPTATRQSFGDHFSGHSNGTDFELYEAHLEQRHTRTVTTKNGTRTETYYVTVFRGALIRINFPRKVEGVTVVTRDAGWFNGLGGGQQIDGRKLKRVGLADPKFEKIFEVYGDDQVLARYMLTPSFMERLLALETALKGTGLCAAFDANSGEGELLISAHTGDQFETASGGSPIPDRATVERILNELRLVTEIVDMVVTPAKFDEHTAADKAN